jgi:pimeloyl-ACP methyl ester carboxylesterase
LQHRATRKTAKLEQSVETRTFVLVHGAWHGGWCWRRVAERLERQGHRVFTPTLTGLGERAHLLSAAVNLDTHIVDVVNVIRYEALSDIVLVGHSYAGFVISGVAEQEEGTIASFVFLDAFVPEDGDSMATIGTPITREAIAAAVKRSDSALPPRPAELFHVNPADRAWVDRLCGPHPIGTFTQPVKLTGVRERIGKKIYIRASGYPNVVFDAHAAKLKARPGWRVEDVPCGHDVMVDMPDHLVDILTKVA